MQLRPAITPSPNRSYRVIRRVLLALGAVVLALVAVVAVQSESAFDDAKYVSQDSRAADLLTRASEVRAEERGATARLLSLGKPPETRAREHLTSLRTRGDKLWNQAIDLMARLSRDHQGVLAVSLEAERQAKGSLARAREKADAALRTGGTLQLALQWIGSVTELNEQSAYTRMALEHFMRHGSSYAPYWSVREWAWRASEQAGLERGILASYIAAGEPLPPAARAKLDRYRVRVATALSLLTGTAARGHLNDAVTRAVGTMQGALGGSYDALRRRIYAAGTSGHYPVSSAAWFSAATDAIDSIIAVSSSSSHAINASARFDMLRDGIMMYGMLAVLLAAAFLMYLGHRWGSSSARALLAAKEDAEKTAERLASELSERRQIEQRLRLYRRAIAHTPDWVAVIDEHYVYRMANPAYLAAHDRSESEVVGHSVTELFSETEFNTQLKPLIDRALAGETGHQETWFNYSGIGRRYVQILCYPDPQEGSGDRAIALSVRDLTELRQTEEELERKSERLRFLTDSMHGTLGYINRDLIIEFANRPYLEIMGREASTVVGCTLRNVVGEAGFQLILPHVQAVLSGRRVTYARELHMGGNDRWLQYTFVPDIDDSGAVIGFVALGVDVTRHKLIRRALSMSRRELRALVMRNPTGLVVVDQNGLVRFANQSAREMLGGSRAGSSYGLSLRLPAGLSRETELDIVRPDGSPGVAEVTVSDTEWRDQPARLLMIHDMTEGKAAREQIERMAYQDALTGLPNRALAQDLLQRALSNAAREGKSVGVLFLDLDRFKVINDTLGHAAGDELIGQVGRRLRANVRQGDVVARMSGDEFLIVLENVATSTSAEALGHQVLRALSEPFSILGRQLSVGASIGISLFPKDGNEGEALIRNADAAMYHAKESGRGTVALYAREMGDRFAAWLDLEGPLRQALEREEFRLLYQPQLDTASGRIVGFEALLRWYDSERGTVSPSEFVPILEETGLIRAVGQWVLEEACRQLALWHEAGYADLRVSVNLSPRQLNLDVVRMVSAALEDSGVPAPTLELEITETTLMGDVGSTSSALSALKELGVRIAVDDFGTGYSSLSYLKEFAVDTLKVDKAFVAGLPDDENDAALTRAIVATGKALGLTLVAEGVEREEQLDFIAGYGCQLWQGFLFSAPVTVDECDALLKGHYPVQMPNDRDARPAQSEDHTDLDADKSG